MRIVLSALFISTLFLSSCHKYSEGPNFSALTRKARLCNDWELKAYSISGNNAFDADYTTKLSIDKDGTYSFSTTTNAIGQIQGQYSHGRWEFADKDETLYFYADTTTKPTHEFSIKELRNKQLVIVEDIFQTGESHRYTYQPQ
ncbi:MAG: hypothetical protein ACKOXP_02995 [Flavobacteriales bacterium]